MPSPFPGVNPYIEVEGYWRAFHGRFLSYLADALVPAFPRGYVAMVDERVDLVGWGQGDSSTFFPDVTIAARPVTAVTSRELVGQVVAQLDVEVIAYDEPEEEEAKHRWIEIRRMPSNELVTVIEVLAPANKRGTGRADYLKKRRELLEQPIHLVEIDLLLSGARLPMKKRLKPAHHYAFVFRAERRPNAQVYAWSIRNELPVIPIPLKAPDSDVMLNLADVMRVTFERCQYDEILTYPGEAQRSLLPEDRAWAEGLAAEATAARQSPEAS